MQHRNHILRPKAQHALRLEMKRPWVHQFDARAWSLTAQTIVPPLMHRHVHGATIPTNEQKPQNKHKMPIMKLLRHRTELLHSPLGANDIIYRRGTNRTIRKKREELHRRQVSSPMPQLCRKLPPHRSSTTKLMMCSRSEASTLGTPKRRASPQPQHKRAPKCVVSKVHALCHSCAARFCTTAQALQLNDVPS